MNATGPSRQTVYVSITGLTLKGPFHVFRFWWHAVLSMRQAKAAAGNISADAQTINGVHHTLTVWESERAMRCFLYQGAHGKAIRAFGSIATGKTFGFETDQVPQWSDVHALWRERGKAYSAASTLSSPQRSST